MPDEAAEGIGIPDIGQGQQEAQNRDVRSISLSTRVISRDTFRHFDRDDGSGGLPAHVLESARREGERNERFWNMLATSVSESGYTPPQDRQSVLLDLACGECREGYVLNSYFGGGEFGSTNNNVKVIGVDIKQDDIEKAKSNNMRPNPEMGPPSYVPSPNHEFYTGDATNLDSIPQVPKQADVVVIRHEQISDSREIWTKIFQQGLARLTDDGIMLLTSFSDVEHEMAIEALQGLGAEVVVNRRNQFAEPTSTPAVSIDRNIAIVKRKPSVSLTEEPQQV